jgi:anthranilate synthase component 1
VASFGVLTQEGDTTAWIDYGLSAERALGDAINAPPLGALAAMYERWQTPKCEDAAPLNGGLVGFIGWEAVRQIENLPQCPPADYALPGQAFSFVAELVIIDHRFGTVTLVANVLGDGPEPPETLWARAQARLDDLQSQLAGPSETWLTTVDMAATPQPSARTRRDDFLAAVGAAKNHIRSGDVFQVVVAQRFDLEVAVDASDVYRVLRSLNPSPYMYLLAFESSENEAYSIVGSSPEALVKVNDGHAFMHPIAGSKPRGATPERDAEFETTLLGDPKERAEHLMLVDLARNDLLKVCVPESVNVTEFMRIERFSHIMHLVSSVEGDLRQGVSPIDVIRATFPAGTLSGAPKPRALELIDELESAQRGLYGGVVGYIGLGGDIDLAIAIRTASIVGGVARDQAGSGIVADSDPGLEFEETENKAAAPLRAVAIANTMQKVR